MDAITTNVLVAGLTSLKLLYKITAPPVAIASANTNRYVNLLMFMNLV